MNYLGSYKVSVTSMLMWVLRGTHMAHRGR